MTPFEVLKDKNISPSSKVVFITLLALSDENNKAHLTDDELIDSVGLGVKVANNSLNELRNRGLVSVYNIRFGNLAKWRMYVLTNEEVPF